VVNQLPQQEHNALLHLFSASGELFAYGARHYRIRSTETSSLLLQLFQRYQEEVLAMPDKLEEFTRETIDQLLRELPVEKRLEGVPMESLLERVPKEKVVERMSVDELLAALSPQTREALARRLKTNGSPSSPD
jgi:hypothetical protein